MALGRKPTGNRKITVPVLLTSAELAEIGDPASPRALPQLAREVDLYWPERAKAFYPLTAKPPVNILTFSGVYVAVYRKGSNFVHADIAAIDRYLTAPKLGAATVHVAEERAESPDYPALGVALAFIPKSAALLWRALRRPSLHSFHI
jgi:hypothetical protein